MAETKVTSIRLPRVLLEKAQELGLNVSKVCENCLREAVKRLEGYTAQTETNGGYTDVRSTSFEEGVVARGRFELPSAGPKPVGNLRFPNPPLTVENVDKVIQDYWEYLRIEERLSYKQAKDYKNVARRLLKLSRGIVSRQAIRDYLKGYLEKAPKTYNNNLDGLRAFIERYLRRRDLIAGFKHTHVPNNYEEELPGKAELQKGFEALETDQEKAIYLFYATSGLRRSEALALTKENVDRKTRCVKSKHDTRTKKAGVTFYNTECAKYLKRIWNYSGDKVFNFKVREFKALWRKASEKARVRIRPQILRKWQATMLGELGVPDRYVDVFQGRAPKTVLAKHYTGKGLERLKRIYDKAGLKVLS